MRIDATTRTWAQPRMRMRRASTAEASARGRRDRRRASPLRIGVKTRFRPPPDGPAKIRAHRLCRIGGTMTNGANRRCRRRAARNERKRRRIGKRARATRALFDRMRKRRRHRRGHGRSMIAM
ncbi:hypothetical protein, partial [Burkholderia pseudomallei]|uniref:hypothetical protein n=1 Tax=Burkholderia pseudomallei TaxID=28450 RepID=UPI0021F7BAE9